MKSSTQKEFHCRAHSYLPQSFANFRTITILLFSGLFAATCQSAWANTLCVNPNGSGGCYRTIGAATSAAAENDIINVAPGLYREAVVIAKPLSLVGASHDKTVIDATGKSNGILVDGIGNPGISNVSVTGFVVENANFEGILIANASSVTVWDNHVLYNDKSLDPSASMCPGLPSDEIPGENDDCGEGIHLMGADHSTVADNIVEDNSGGILMSDDTIATHDNLITRNVVRNNSFDCGITLATHRPAALTGLPPAGVFQNTIAHNESIHNGTAVQGAGAGVGIFDAPGANPDYGNVVVGNQLTDNGATGVAMHLHVPGQTLHDNVIVGNFIARNHADSGDAATSGPTGINIYGVLSAITGIVISRNVFDEEQIDIAVNTDAQVDIHLNDFLGGNQGIDNLGSGLVNATGNWWGCRKGPGSPKCAEATGNILFNPWLSQPSQPDNDRPGGGQSGHSQGHNQY